jgi:hypothetical protein
MWGSGESPELRPGSASHHTGQGVAFGCRAPLIPTSLAVGKHPQDRRHRLLQAVLMDSDS